MNQLNEEQAHLLKTVMGSMWSDFVAEAEENGFTEEDCEALYAAVGGEN
ncbi:hypothetical protein HWC07_gp022 [Pantoea phage vB_PagM_LIET2]|uniref:Uncharacterized protein n=1 Tax=Pantoea phage vB_PagM_LIET2 TaxID=2508071 RepID=A0A411AVZ5_9CAUD|nr:hypothetical protein HWC07_gp022 [Pantoea phage vB_PagM_LIET2]QAX92274.1 hypothetical protein LIET2_gp022 [Pantoea phage vB_PagM_LIET2]